MPFDLLARCFIVIIFIPFTTGFIFNPIHIFVLFIFIFYPQPFPPSGANTAEIANLDLSPPDNQTSSACKGSWSSKESSGSNQTDISTVVVAPTSVPITAPGSPDPNGSDASESVGSDYENEDNSFQGPAVNNEHYPSTSVPDSSHMTVQPQDLYNSQQQQQQQQPRNQARQPQQPHHPHQMPRGSIQRHSHQDSGIPGIGSHHGYPQSPNYDQYHYQHTRDSNQNAIPKQMVPHDINQPGVPHQMVARDMNKMGIPQQMMSHDTKQTGIPQQMVSRDNRSGMPPQQYGGRYQNYPPHTQQQIQRQYVQRHPGAHQVPQQQQHNIVPIQQQQHPHQLIQHQRMRPVHMMQSQATPRHMIPGSIPPAYQAQFRGQGPPGTGQIRPRPPHGGTQQEVPPGSNYSSAPEFSSGYPHGQLEMQSKESVDQVKFILSPVSARVERRSNSISQSIKYLLT